MIRTGCCGQCCVCTRKDTDFADPDGTGVVEEWTSAGVQDVIQESSQNFEQGSPFTCKNMAATQPPCRELALGYTQLRTNVKEGRFGFLITVTGTNSLPGFPGSFWSGAYNCTLTNDRTMYRDGSFAAHNCEITTTGTTIRATIDSFLGSLAGATYEGSIDDGAIPIDITQNPLTVNLVSQHDPALTWPGSITLDPALSMRFGPFHGVRWWRLYPDKLTFHPDGTGPLLSLCYDTCNVSGGYATAETDDLPPVPGPTDGGTRLFTLVLKQGDQLALAYPVGGTVTDDPETGWRHCVVPPQPITSLEWVDFSGNPWVGDQATVLPDFSDGAEPIVFGIGIQANGSSSTRNYLIKRRLDNVCISLRRQRA